MNALDIKVIKTTPAEVNFNYDEISQHLGQVLKQYTGIIVTEDTIADGEKVIAELRKGQKSLDEFRKKTKKELTKSVTDFENQCKELSKKFDEVIDPILEQADQFEEKRKEEKAKEVQKLIDEVCELKGLESLPLEDSYLNKSTSLKSIKTDLMKAADNILLEQATLKSAIELIKARVNLSNAENDLNILPEPYIKMLDYTDVDTILGQIEKDAERLNSIKPISVPPEIKQVAQAPSKNEEIYEDTYIIEGTETQLDALEEFLNRNSYKWRVE